MDLVQKEIDGFNMNLCLNDGGISSVLYNVGERERVFMTLLKITVKEGDVALDLGGNIGYTVLPMCRNVGPNGQIYVVEPDPHNFEILTKNIKDNGFEDRTESLQCCISDKNEDIEFWIASAPNLNSIQKTKNSIKSMMIPSIRLDTFLNERKYPNFIKMDVEGAEVSIFESGLDYFDKNKGRTNILMEVHPQFYHEQNNFEKILKEYMKIGFNCKWVVSTPVAQPDLFKEKGYEPKQSISTDGFVRGLYDDISNEDLCEFACHQHDQSYSGGVSKKIVRCMMLSRSV